ncbi:MFS transporter [Motilibacter sp. E257]|uniref:MFS transporter n=1 Tax=Motilibacter deserti TaxID=2714956 RepID=A0ABX0GVS5_9ACTN|nr:MFS transporter [Motilibacter deserti]NHC15057.1 MFS transporter [Motilibacter deserti]
MPIYPLYALLFADSGLDGAQISVLLAVWSAVGIVAEVPTGALADRFSRRTALAVAGVLQALGYVLWIALPGFAGFAAGFVLWGLGGALASGAFEALVYDGLAARGEAAAYPRLLGHVRAAGLLAQLPAAGGATVLFAVGGYALAGWVSVALCLASSAVALRLPEAPTAEDDEPEPGYVDLLRAGVAEAASSPPLRSAVLVVALLEGLDAFEEYFPLLARAWGVPTAAVPLAMVAIPLAGALGALVAGRRRPPGARRLGGVLGTAAVVLLAAALAHRAGGMAAVAVFYGLYRYVLVFAEARLQDEVRGPARATVTSVAGLGSELSAFAVYAAWALGEAWAVGALVLVAAGFLTRSGRRQ